MLCKTIQLQPMGVGGTGGGAIGLRRKINVSVPPNSSKCFAGAALVDSGYTPKAAESYPHAH